MTLTYLHVFGVDANDGFEPAGPLLRASDGNFYGTTLAGGTHNCRPQDPVPCGTVFKVTPGGTETVFYSFGASATDAYSPTAPLIQGKDGALYGVTTGGGAHGGGTLFRITLAGTETVLYSFGATASDGIVPIGGLVQGNDDNFYGETASGGANHCDSIPQSGGNCGTIFRVTPQGVETVLHSFGNSNTDGIEPNGSLLLASDGNFYGTTSGGGVNGCSFSIPAGLDKCGTAFRMTPAGGVTILHSFGTGLSAGLLTHDGIAPSGGLIQGTDGALYGTTLSGGFGRCGNSFGCGTVFKMTTAGQVTILYEFAVNNFGSDGYGPNGLMQAADGNFYGTTGSGGIAGGDLAGTIFRLTPSGVKTVLYSFGQVNTNPSNPQGGLVQASNGVFYGITFYNGQYGGVGARQGFGTVFKLEVQ